MTVSRIGLDEAVDVCRTGDVWIFRGRSVADRAIQLTTNSPVNHVGMAVTIEDLPALMWHAELGRSLTDRWSGNRQRGVQLHDLREAVVTWAGRYGQRAWLRQLHVDETVRSQKELEDAALRSIARLDGTPFPTTARLASRWLTGRVGRRTSQAALETAFCAEVVALTYAEMGLLEQVKPPNWYDPGTFWSGDDLGLALGARLGEEIAVTIDPSQFPPDLRGTPPAQA